MLFKRLLSHTVRTGTLFVTDANGRRHEFGNGGDPCVSVTLHDPTLHWLLLLRPRMAAGEAYMDGRLTIEKGTIYDLMVLVCQSNPEHAWPWLTRIIDRTEQTFRALHQFNLINRSRENVAHHYDLSGQLYDLFLDKDKQYSCAYFTENHDDIDRAQSDKKAHIAAKLMVQPGQRILDIGCGWGGMAITLAKDFDCHVTGLTLSREQYNTATERVRKLGLSNRVKILLEDYRVHAGHYNRIVSVGMLEHVGIHHYNTYFKRLREMLDPSDGVALVHTIGRLDGPGATDSWIRKYIFPGGYNPALSEVTPAIETNNLLVTDVEILRLHYAKTLRLWRQNFLKNQQKAAHLYDQRFVRMWEFYLAASEIAFRYLSLAVFQIQMSTALDQLPITRDYMTNREHELRKQITTPHKKFA